MQWPRRILQFGFLALILVVVFGLVGNAEAWCPFGGVEAIYTYWTEGSMTCSLAMTNFYVLGGLLLTLVLVRRAWCSHLCPIGTVSEYVGKAGRKLGIKQIQFPRRVNQVLGLGKYVVLGLILYVTWQAGELLFRTACPSYALLSRHGEDITFWAYVVAGGIVLTSLALVLPFCRYFCPLAAVMNPLSKLGLMRVKRTDACIDCGQCAKACPMDIDVDKKKEVTDARCTSCMQCVSSCPVKDKGALVWGPAGTKAGRWPAMVVPVALVVVAAGVVFASQAWPLPSFVYVRPDVEPPAETAVLDLEVKGLECRGSAQNLVFFADRDDFSKVYGYLKVEAWPSPAEYSRVRITYDPLQADEMEIQDALLEPYYLEAETHQRPSPFEIKGYEPWAVEP